MTTTTQKIAELTALATDVKTDMYKRVKLAFEILADVDWIEAAHQGKAIRAMDYLHRKGFPYVSLTVGQLAAIYRKWPEEASWQEYDYDVNLMYDMLRGEKKAKQKQANRISWRTKCEELVEELRLLKIAYSKLETREAQLEGEIKGIKETLRQGVPT